MLLPIAFLPLAAALINDVTLTQGQGTLTIDVATSDVVSPEGVRTLPAGAHRMYLYLDGTVANRHAYGSGSQEVYVHPRARYTKLEIPTLARCTEPVAIEPHAHGIRVRMACQETGTASSVPPPVRVRDGQRVERPLPDAPGTALAPGKETAESLRAALALPREAIEGDPAGEATPDEGKARPAGEVAGKKGQAEIIPSAAAKPAVTGNPEGAATKPSDEQPKAQVKAQTATTAQPDAPTAVVAGTEPNTPSPGNGSEGKSASGAIPSVLAVLVLLALGTAAFVLTRRRASKGRMIRIVETASIGPRRSLVVANVGGRTMVLGVSEAGVSLLDSQGVAGPEVEPEPVEKVPSRSLEQAALGLRDLLMGRKEADAGKPVEVPREAKQEESLLGRLFHGTGEPAPSQGRSREFEDLLSESLEDEDLRRKLASGQSGRVA